MKANNIEKQQVSKLVKNKTMYTSDKVSHALSEYIQQEFCISFLKSLDDLKKDPNIDMEVLNSINDTVSDYIDNYVNKKLSKYIFKELADFNSIKDIEDTETNNSDNNESDATTKTEEDSKSSNGTFVVQGFVQR